MKSFMIEVKRGVRIPLGYGVVCDLFDRDVWLCCPIPCNIIMRWARNAYFWLASPGYDVQGEIWTRGYYRGYRDACDSLQGSIGKHE